MPRKKWSEIRRTLSPEREAAMRAEIEAEIKRMKLPELRRAHAMTQATISDLLGIAQGDVSKLERRTDSYVGTLRRYVEALGGTLRIIANFPGADPIEISGFGDIEPPRYRVNPTKALVHDVGETRETVGSKAPAFYDSLGSAERV